VLLTLEEKKEPYQTKLVDLSNKPDWFVRLRSFSPPLNVPHTLKQTPSDRRLAVFHPVDI
jgi:hypothetical protein